jgi:hypothetical protein
MKTKNPEPRTQNPIPLILSLSKDAVTLAETELAEVGARNE